MYGLKLTDKNDNTIAIKTAINENGKSGSRNAEPKIRNGDCETLFRYLFLATNIKNCL